MKIAIFKIPQLVTLKTQKTTPKTLKELSEITLIKDGAVYIEDGIIKYYGKEKDVLSFIKGKKINRIIEANGVVLPSFIDSHTHAVFAKSRIEDFQMRTQGLSYQEIKKRGGGINRSVKHLRKAAKKHLFDNLKFFAERFIECGSLTVEVKSGYGLDLKNEIKILEVVKEFNRKFNNIEFVPTFLGAHSIPEGFKDSTSYLKYLKEKVIPYVAEKKLAKYCDIFCEKGYFGVEESTDYLNYCKKYGLIPKVHAEQLSKFGGCKVANRVKAISADHVDMADLKYINLLRKSNTVATFLPASNYFLNLKYPDARKFIENGVIVSLATDFNPGTSPCWNMQFVISLAVTHMKMKIEEAINAAVYNAAFALNLENTHGSIDINKQADLNIFDVKDYREIAYYFGDNLNKCSIKKGRIVYEKNHTF